MPSRNQPVSAPFGVSAITLSIQPVNAGEDAPEIRRAIRENVTIVIRYSVRVHENSAREYAEAPYFLVRSASFICT